MPVINTKAKVITLINTFTVKPEKQMELIGVLNEATEKFMMKLDGFVSASVHRGIDGKSVANYAQWESKEHMDRMYNNPAAQEHMQVAAKLAEKFEPFLYVIDSTHEREQ